MTVPVSNMVATMANTSYRYDAIGMDANTFGQADGSTLINLRANNVSKFEVDIYGNANVAGVLTADVLVANTITSGSASNPAYDKANAANLLAQTTYTYAANNVMLAANSAYAQANTAVSGGQQTIWVPAGAMTPTTTNGAESVTQELVTNDVMISYLAFDATTQENACFQIQMPKSWNEGTIISQFVWTHPTTATNFGVVWGIQSVAFANDNPLDTAFGTAVEIADTGGTANDCYITSETSAMTVAGTPGAEEFVIFKVYRDPTDGSDTMAVDARLLGVKLHYTTDTITDN